MTRRSAAGGFALCIPATGRLSGEGVSTTLTGAPRSLNCPSFKQIALSYKRPYSMNGNLSGPPAPLGYGTLYPNPTEKDPSYTSYYFGIHSTLVIHPSTKMLFQDTENSTGGQIDVVPSLEVSPGACWNVTPSLVAQGTLGNGSQCAFRHGGAMPSVYVDLHADMLLPAKELNSQKRYRYDQ